MYLFLPFYFHLTFIYINCLSAFEFVLLFFFPLLAITQFPKKKTQFQFVTIVCVCVRVLNVSVCDNLSTNFIRENVCNYFCVCF